MCIRDRYQRRVHGENQMGCCYGSRAEGIQSEILMMGRNEHKLDSDPLTQAGIPVGLQKGFQREGDLIECESAKLVEPGIKLEPITSEDIRTGPELWLEVVESPTLPKKQFEINPAGYSESLRAEKDGCVYMGTAEFTETGVCANDIIVPKEEEGMGEVHLLIQYQPSARNYFIKDLGQGTGTFIKIDCPLLLEKGYIISFGDSHMLINKLSAEEIQLKFLDGPKIDQMFTFHKNDGVVTVGRMTGCQIKFENFSLSRYQCSVYNQNGEWMLEDGTGEKRSTNGSWLFLENFFPMHEGMVIKAGQSLFCAHLIFNHQGQKTVSYTHLTLPTILLVQISVVAVSLKKKKTLITEMIQRVNSTSQTKRCYTQ
eukprot:TRINITY_DN7149_c0_g1_i2.p1 TRINITY_DN7149_c0_g1~~TRINITY_DN7149_c0_g1_i2.p1  ORF type:complete len:370 (-),score=64.05 TRINITY_DN7149_c0_g1_i2:23-1132(-)